MIKPDILKPNVHFFNYPFGVLLTIILLQLLSHYNHSPLWLILFVAVIACFGFFTYKVVRKKVSVSVRTMLVILSVIIFFLYYKTNFTVDMATSFLVLASTLKFLELKNKKDVTLFVYIMLYLSAVSFLFVQSFIHAVLQLILILANLYVLLRLNGGPHLYKYQAPWSSLFKTMMLAGPIVLVCFLFVPRIAPLWSIPIKTQNATTGMTDFMSPGDIAELAQSSERAFRVTFYNQIPEKKDLYWRGLVLDHFDGRSWRSNNSNAAYQGFNKVDLGILYEHGVNAYEVMLEPSNQSWVYALEPSRASSSNVLIRDAGVFQLKTDAVQSTRYKMTFKASEAKVFTAIPTAKLLQDNKRRNLNKVGRRIDLQVPKRSNSRTQKYVKDLLVSFPDKINFINYLMRVFSEQEYFYTLKPPVLGDDVIDEFLFDTKQGFCAHYASSLAYMLRLADIPARVIAGYQGGEYNQNSRYFIVHQYDAHAWVEAKLPGLGWVRLDPTAMVAPERIINGLDVAVGEQGSFLEGSPIASTILKISGLNWLRLRADEFNYKWQKLVVNYGNGEQQSLIKRIFSGFLPNTGELLRVLVLVGGFFALLITLVLLILWHKRYAGRYSNAEKYYMLWLYFLAQLSGLKRMTGETPNAFLLRVQSSGYKRLAKVTKKITTKLEQDQYQL